MMSWKKVLFYFASSGNLTILEMLSGLGLKLVDYGSLDWILNY